MLLDSHDSSTKSSTLICCTEKSIDCSKEEFLHASLITGGVVGEPPAVCQSLNHGA